MFWRIDEGRKRIDEGRKRIDEGRKRIDEGGLIHVLFLHPGLRHYSDGGA